MAKKGIPDGPFPDRVCNRLRALNIKIKEGKDDRAAAFAERDAANVKLDELEHGSDDHTLASVEYAEACRKIETLQHSLRWWHQEMLTTIDKADEPEQGELFGNSKDPLNIKPPPLEPKKPKAKKAEDEPVEQHPHPSEKNTAKFDFEGGALPKDIGGLFDHAAPTFQLTDARGETWLPGRTRPRPPRRGQLRPSLPPTAWPVGSRAARRRRARSPRAGRSRRRADTNHAAVWHRHAGSAKAADDPRVAERPLPPAGEIRRGGIQKETRMSVDLLAELRGTKCPYCLGVKAPRKTLCGGCYHKLPAQMKNNLYRKFGAGYEEAYAQAITFLWQQKRR